MELTESSPLFETNGINIRRQRTFPYSLTSKLPPMKPMLRFHTISLLAIVTCFFGCVEEKEHETKPLNVLYIMADDLAYQAISAYGSPISKLAPTPNWTGLPRTVHVWMRCTVPIQYVARVGRPF